MTLSNFSPAIWTNEIARNLEKFLVYAQPGVVNRDHEGEISGAGDTVKIKRWILYKVIVKQQSFDYFEVI